MAKRKLDASSEDGSDEGQAVKMTPKTKKQKREEAIANAKKWGQEDKARMLAKKQGATATATATTTKPPPAPPSSTKKPAAAAAASSAKKPAPAPAAAAVPAPAPVKAPAVASLPQPNNNAAVNPQTVVEYMRPLHPGAAFPPTSPVAAYSPATYPAPYGYWPYPQQWNMMQQQGMYANANNAAAAAYMQSSQEDVWRHNQQQAAGAATAANYTQPIAPAPVATTTQVKVNSSTPAAVKKKTPVSPPNWASSAKKADDDDDEPMPPPLDLQSQISALVVANESAYSQKQPLPHTTAPPAAFATTDNDDEEEEDFEPDDQPIIVDEVMDEITSSAVDYKKATQVSWGYWLVAILSIAVAISAIFAALDEQEVAAPKITSAPKGELPCYLDSVPRYSTVVSEEQDEDGNTIRHEQKVLIRPCPDMDAAVPCPTLGNCQDGKLMECSHKNFEVSPDDSECILSTHARETVDLWKRTLMDRTIQEICRTGSLPTDPLPVFDYQELQLLYPDTLATNPLDRLVLQSEFATQREDGRYYIGLPDDTIVQLPLNCRISQLLSTSFKAFLNAMGNLAWMSFKYMGMFTWNLARAYPFSSLIGLVVILLMYTARTMAERRRRLIRDVATMRDKAFQKLQEQSQEAHAILHLRDAIVDELVGHADILTGGRKQREYWNKQVWPRVKPQLEQDNRVRKTQRVDASNKNAAPRVYWQWVAAVSTTGSAKKIKSVGIAD